MSESVKERTTKNRPKCWKAHPSVVKHRIEEWFEDFEKQEEEKQNISTIQILEKIDEIKDMNIQSKTKEMGAFIYGFRKGYLQRGEEILG